MRLLAIAAAASLMPVVADAKPRRPAAKAGAEAKSAPACGAKVLPLVVGNSWTYGFVAPPEPPLDAIKRISPAQIKTIVITVKAIEQKAGETVATLEEKVTTDRTREENKPLIDERSYESTITCTDKKFDISPNSFFFAGEPGGYLGLEIASLERLKGTSLALVKGAIGEAEWREDLAITYTRKPTEGSGAQLGGGKVELERRFTPQDPEPIVVKPGTYKAEKIGLITTGRVTVDQPKSPTMKPMELPAGWVSQLWLAEGVGLVQSLNSYAHMYQLTELTLK